ncbi:MAG: hypothetical protein E7633_02945 [Ruminococcaceae bacterium]|nr:hypothetical protein [Oscillospiraceae bacterium]
MNGKKKCKILKEIRRQIAMQNDIEYITSECQHKGDCRGTCPKCEAEVRYLEKELEKRQKLGRTVAVAGIAVALAVSSVGCDEDTPSKYNELNGNVVIEDDQGEAVVDGEMLPPFITVSELLSLSETERNQYISGFSRNDIRYEWENEDSVLGDTQDIFYTEDGDYKIIVDYDENGMAISIEIIFWGVTAGDPAP